MKIYRDICIAGKTILVRERPASKRTPGAKRAQRTNITSEQVKKINILNCIRKLTAILNNNFKPGDHHLQLTYSAEPSKAQAKKDKEKFFRQLRIKCKKEGIELIWVAITEYEGKRIHHHIICNNIPMNIIKECWPHGIVFHNPLWDNPNYHDLAEYLIKEAEKHLSDEQTFKRKYTTSRNVIVPETKREEITRNDMEEETKPFKKYFIDGEVNTYEHAYTRLTCKEYIMVSLEEKPRYKKWYKGTKLIERNNYQDIMRKAYHEQQESLF